MAATPGRTPTQCRVLAVCCSAPLLSQARGVCGATLLLTVGTAVTVTAGERFFKFEGMVDEANAAAADGDLALAAGCVFVSACVAIGACANNESGP